MKKKRWTESLSNFIEGKGFYIVLLLCLAIIGISVYYLVNAFSVFSIRAEEPVLTSGKATVTETQTVEEERLAETQPSETATSAAAVAEPVAETVAESSVVEEEPAATDDPESLQDTVSEITTWPVQGTVVAAFSVDVLQRNETMGDWRTHCGIDLSAEVGANVQAVGSGIVTEIRDDLLLGRTMTIDHGGGLVSVYGNLAEETLVSTGDHVTAGCVIGQVGETASGELSQGAHLHFAMEQNGEPVEPGNYLPG